MLGKFVDWLTRVVAWSRRNQVHHPRGAMVKLNLGSGLSVAPGWINLDGSLSALVASLPAPLIKLVYRLTSLKVSYRETEYVEILARHKFIFHNLAYGIPFPDDSIDFIYSAHLLEHLTRADARQLTRAMWRVLKPGGCVRITVPDLARAFELYQHGKTEQALGFFFLDAASDLGRHQYMYDFESLAALLTNAGFRAIERRAFQSGDTPDLVLLDNRPEQTLYVEARK
ncbi:MAG: methyltransferase domain-containing protein [Chloroflexi bacterium]|nr:methyltransferase domain-containing protein [Chloroflexota bacterium]